ncbi:MAG: sugar phosphate isomerase/epimerase family protein [Planctomycetota bacterium]
MPSKSQPQIAITLYNLRAYTAKPRQIARTLGRVRKIGYQAVQISGGGLMDVDPPELKKMADDAGVDIIGSHIALGLFRDDIGSVIDRLHAWGCPYAAIPSLPGELWQKSGAWPRLAKQFSGYGRKLADEGLTLQYHNHNFEFHRVGVRGGRGGRLGLEILFDKSDPELLQSELDVGWVARGGGDPAAYVRWLKGRLDQVHIKDWGIAEGAPAWMPVGEGNLNMPEIVKACRGAGVKHYIYEQDTCPTTVDEWKAARISYENMRELGLK